MALELVKIDFTAKEVSTGIILETTLKQENAKSIGKPMIIDLASNELFPKVVSEIKQMNANEEKKVVLKAQDAFGERKSELVGVIPLQQFKERNINPVPGLIVDLNEQRGKVQSVSGGRVKVDFNHELAGKQIEVQVKLIEKITGKENQARALAEKYLPFYEENDIKINLKENAISIVTGHVHNHELVPQIALAKEFLAHHLMKIEGIEKINLTEEFEKAEGKKNKMN